MKTIAVSIVLVLGLTAPALAQTTNAPPAETAAAPVESASVSDEVLLDDATTPEARKMMLLRCSGPPPRPKSIVDAMKSAPIPEPVIAAAKTAGGASSSD